MKRGLSLLLALLMILVLVPSFASAETKVVNVVLANNPLSQALADLAKENYKKDGVEINIAILPENDMREKLTTEASSGGNAYDMFYIGPYEAQTWARNGWLEDLTPYFEAMTEEQKAWYDYADLIPGMMQSLALDGKQYAIPYYGESSFIMYNKELFDKAGLTMPEKPTWTEIYDLAVALQKALGEDYVGMTMRGMPGWGMSGAPFVTMVNAFGGQFYDMDWNAKVDTAEQRAAWEMYKKILRDAGQKDILSYSYNECIALMMTGKCGMYYDATSICAGFEAEGSPIKGKMGYVAAPHQVKETNTSWLWNWAMGINPKSDKKQEVFDFMLWATSKDFINLTLEKDPSGASTPQASRSSLYSLPAYANVPYAPATLAALQSMDFNDPCVNPVPYTGLQYIAIPEFADAGDKMTQWLAEFVTDQITLDQAIANTQALFEEIAVEGEYKG